MKKTLLAAAISSALTLTGCLDSDNIDQSAAPKASSIPATTVTFDPLAGKLSTPTDLLMDPAVAQGGGGTGLIKIPKTGDIYESLNSLDGWGISSPIAIGMTFPDSKYGEIELDSTTVESSGAVILMEKDGAVLTYGTDFIVKASSSGLVIVPLKPLKASQQYLFAVTDSVKDELGRKIEASQYYKLLSDSSTDVTTLTSDATNQAKLTAIKNAISAVDSGLSALAGSADIVYSGSFTTQSVGKVMAKVMAQIDTANPMIGSVTDAKTALAAKGITSLTDNKLSSFLTAVASSAQATAATQKHDPLIYFGGMVLPYFLDTPTAANCAADLSSKGTCDALTSYWQNTAGNTLQPADYAPSKQSDHTVQVFISVPDPSNLPTGITKPADGWPVALYVHGITSYKETAAAIAGNLAAQGIALVAIDLPLHGSRSIDFNSDGVYEITTTDKSNGDQYANGSPLVFANLGALRTVRDNLRQSISDVLALRSALTDTPAYTDSGSNVVAEVDLDGDSVSLLGVSLGSIVSTGVLGASDSYDANDDGSAETDADNPFDFKAAALTVGGSQAAAIMGYSNSFGPVVKEALKKNDAFSAAVAGNLGYSATDFIALRTSEPATYSNLANIAYPTFLSSFVAGAQQVIDSADAIAWASKINSDTPVLVTQVVGNGVNLSDQTVPNSTSSNGFPLGGTTPLIGALGLTKTSSAKTPSATDLKVYTNFLVGKHTSLLDPAAATGVTQDATSAAAATTEMQTQVISFLKSGGKALQGSASGGALNTNVVQ